MGYWNILLIECNKEDLRVWERALVRPTPLPGILHVVEQADEAVVRLERHELPVPSLIILNTRIPEKLRTPEMDSAIRELRRKVAGPVLFFCGSDQKSDVERAYRGYASSYTRIPEDPDRYTEVVRATLEFWLTLVELPTPYHPVIPEDVAH
jgi:DNA-binding NarL/FixJ family response regulator